MLRRTMIAAALMVSMMLAGIAAAMPAPNPTSVLVYGPSVSGSPSLEEQKASAQGFTVVKVSAAQWSAMTTAEFATYRAIIIGDPFCSGSTATVAAAIANTAVWGPAINGNVFIIGSDPVFHSFQGGATVTDKGIAFAASDPVKTGAYITLSCYYHGAPALTPVPLLDAFSVGGFSVIGGAFIGGLNNVHIVASHPSLSGLTDATLSNWGNSVHEGFTSWPVNFEVLAMAVDGTRATYTAPDGTVGVPYILARGVRVISNITLSPESATNPVKTSHTVIATVLEDGQPVSGTIVKFEVIDGPNAGVTGAVKTDDHGNAFFSYSSGVAGIDTIEARYVSSTGVTQRSNRVTKEWIGVKPIVCNVGVDTSINEDTIYMLDATSSGGGLAPLTYFWSGPYTLDDPTSPTPFFHAPVVSGNVDATFTLTVSDAMGQRESCRVTITVIDSDLPPDCSNARPSLATLWPPNHKLHDVTISGVVDTEDPSVSLVVTGITQDEPVNGLGDGDIAPDGAIVNGSVARLRAERSGLEDGRVYEVHFTATDGLGQSCDGSVTVGVPHDKLDTPVDSGQAYDSTVE